MPSGRNWTARPHVLRPLRRRLQRTHIDALIDLSKVVLGTVRRTGGERRRGRLRPSDSCATSSRSWPPRGKATHDPSTAAHFDETHARIVRFLHAQTVV